jgi:hypothetical protein
VTQETTSVRNVWLVLVSMKGRYVMHSMHITEEKAREWSKCKEHDGEDTTVASVDHVLLTDFIDGAQK